NRLSRTSSVSSVSSVVQNYSSNDLLTNHTYDDNGNTTSSPSTDYASIIHDGIPATGTISDVYDFRNKLIRRSFVGGKTILLSYDADGNRVSKQVLDTASATFSEREHHYLVDTNNHTGYAQVAEERDGSGFLTRVNHYGHDLVATDFITEGYQRYYQYDGLGSVRALSDGNGDVTDEYTYDAFGILIDTTGSTPNDYLYTGEQWDADLGMYFLRARYNNVQTGRFHSMDTYEGRRGEPMTLHKYLYAHANPVSNIDPSGHFILSFALAGGALTADFGTKTADFARAGAYLTSFGKALVPVFGTTALAGTGVYLYLKANAEAMAQVREKLRIKAERLRRGRGVVYHYTDKASALMVMGSASMKVTPPYKGAVTYPQGAYASLIPPYAVVFTQSQLSAHFYGGNTSKDVSWSVMLSDYGFLPVFGGYPDFRYKPGALGGYTTVQPIAILPNLMDAD
ncbi:MAG: RHS repeat-associated core domain-containing protein, partial [Akkermansiaceae bacterium]